jgi:hypothetical protein
MRRNGSIRSCPPWSQTFATKEPATRCCYYYYYYYYYTLPQHIEPEFMFLKLSLYLLKHHALKAYGGMEIQLHHFDLDAGRTRIDV